MRGRFQFILIESNICRSLRKRPLHRRYCIVRANGFICRRFIFAFVPQTSIWVHQRFSRIAANHRNASLFLYVTDCSMDWWNINIKNTQTNICVTMHCDLWAPRELMLHNWLRYMFRLCCHTHSNTIINHWRVAQQPNPDYAAATYICNIYVPKHDQSQYTNDTQSSDDACNWKIMFARHCDRSQPLIRIWLKCQIEQNIKTKK